jgi:hypothetical protein
MFEAFKLYKESILFEFEHEKIYHEVFGIRDFIKYFPRSVVIYNNLNKYLFFINYFLFIPLYLFWGVLINPILALIYFLKRIPALLKSRSDAIPNDVYLTLSDIKFFAYLDRDQVNYPIAILQFPFHVSQHFCLTNIKVIEFINVTEFKYMVQAFILSILTPFLIIFTKQRHLMLFTYTSFNWYWVYFSFRKTSFNSIWLSNHYDRWVKLVDGLKKVANKIVVQHGQLEYVQIETGKVYFPVFSKRLRSISKVYAIDRRSIDYFLKVIDSNSVEFEILKSKLNVVSWPLEYNFKFKILVLGHKNDYWFHSALINQLQNKGLLNIAYKKHPQQIVNDSFNGCWLITLANDIPYADVVISYGSSLDNEIRQLFPDTKIVIYGFDEKFNSEVAIKSIEDKLFDFLKIETDNH